MSAEGRWVMGSGHERPTIEALIVNLDPGQRFAANWMVDDVHEAMVGGVYRDADGVWYVYTEDATDCSRDAVSAFAEFGEASRAWWGEGDWVLYVEPYGPGDVALARSESWYRS